MKNIFDPLHKKWPRGIVKTLRLPLPIPAPLNRPDGPIGEAELSGMNFLVGSAGKSELVSGLSAFLSQEGAGIGEAEKVNGLVFDAREIKTVEELTQVYEFFHAHIKKVKNGGRVLILGVDYENINQPVYAAVQRALEGISRTLAKETGHRGTTAQLILMDQGVAVANETWPHRVYPVVHFLLSHRSSFISGQVYRIDGSVQVPGNIPLHQSLAGKTALVTGAARGIGAEAARVMAREGAKVIVLDIPQAKEDAEKLAKEIGGIALLLDVSAADTPDKIRDFVTEELGGLDILVNNAGVTRDKTIAKMPLKFWEQSLQINLAGPIRITESLLESGLKDYGRILFISSISGISGNFGQTNYAAAKAGMIAYVSAMAPTIGVRGININALAPGFIETDMTKKLPLTVKEGGRRLSNLKQGGLTRDIAEGITFLSSPGAAGVTGQVLRICGGSMIGA